MQDAKGSNSASPMLCMPGRTCCVVIPLVRLPVGPACRLSPAAHVEGAPCSPGNGACAPAAAPAGRQQDLGVASAGGPHRREVHGSLPAVAARQEPCRTHLQVIKKPFEGHFVQTGLVGAPSGAA